MSLGMVEVIALLMGLAGFGVTHNPKAPTADQALEYAVSDADIVAHFDAASVIPGNYKVLMGLQNQPRIKASPELARMVRKAVTEIEGPRALVKNMVGIDVTTDIADATAFVRFVPKHDPNLLVAVHGRFQPAIIDKIAKLTGKAVVNANGAAWVDTGDDNAVALTRSGVLLVGTTALVRERIATAWHKPALTPGTKLASVAKVLDAKPVFAVFMMLGRNARTEVLSKIDGQNFATDVIKRHKLASFAIYDDGIGWSWIDSQRRGLDAMTQISQGMVEVLRAAQIAPRGFAKIVMGALESYRGTNKQIDDVIRHKADIQKLVESYTGDGTFKAQVDKNPATLELNVRLTGKSLSEVLPAGGIVPMAVLGMVMAKRDMAAPTPQIAVPPPPGGRATPPRRRATPPRSAPPRRP